MPTAVLTPFDRSPGRRDGLGRWRKRLLPVGEVRYEGRILKFTQDYLGKLAAAFKAKAYDQVPFQLAGSDNKHTNDVERTAGQVAGMDVDLNGPDGPGLYIDLTPTERGKQVLADNPGVGVSARIVEEYDRSDGKFWPAAIQHVLATLDPRIPGLGPWRTVEAANGITMTIDLSGLSFAGDDGGSTMPDIPDALKARLDQIAALPDSQWQQLITGLSAPGLTPEELAALGIGDSRDGNDDPSDEDLAALVASLPDEDLAALEMEYQQELAGAGAATGLSVEAVQAIELAQQTGAEALRQLGDVNAELDQQRFATERRRFYDMGVPAPVLKEFAPLLQGTGHVIEMSNGETVDAGAVVRRGLAEYARMAQLLDLSGEQGSGLDVPEQHQEQIRARTELVDRARQQMFGLR